MATPSRSRPVSATITASKSASVVPSSSSYFTDRSGIPGLDGVPSATRPLPGLLDLVVEAAHTSHESRKLLHPSTSAYALFNWRVTGSTQQPSLTASSSNAKAGHSSTSIHAWAAAPAKANSPSSQPSTSRVNATGVSSTTARPSSATGAPTSGRRASASQLIPCGVPSRELKRDDPAGTPTADVHSSGKGPAGAVATEHPRSLSTSVAPGPTTGGNPTAAEVSSLGAAVSSQAARSRPASASSGPREIARPAVVARALAPWEGGELEVVCLYDSNFQAANRRGQQGLPLRAPAPRHIGPISYLYRWYCKRATQFRGDPPAWVLTEAPTMPPTSCAPASSARSPTSADGPSSHRVPPTSTPPSTSSVSRPSSASRAVRSSNISTGSAAEGLLRAGGGCGGAGRGATMPAAASTFGRGPPVSVWRPPRPSASASGGIQKEYGSATGGGGGHNGTSVSGRGSLMALSAVSSAAAATAAAATSSGRRLNTALDPVISLSELIELLEDLKVVPQRASRLDIKNLFEAAVRAAPSTAVSSAPAPSATAAASTSKSASAAVFAATIPASQAAGPQRQQQTPQRRQEQQQQQPANNPGRGAARRPASAPRGGATTLTRSSSSSTPSVAAAAKTTTAAAVAGDGDAWRVQRPQVHPDEVRFPVFKDVLIRLAVAISCTEPPYATAEVAVAAAGLTRRASTSSVSSTTDGGPTSLGAVTSAGVGGGVHGGGAKTAGRTISSDAAVAAVRRLLDHMGLHRSDVRGLKHRLDELARMAGEAAARAQAAKRQYVAVPSPVAAAADVDVAPAPAAPPPATVAAAAAARAAGPPVPWRVLSPVPAPPYLMAILAEEDQGDDSDYRPAWREFGSTALELGVVQPGEVRQCRLMLHSRGPHTLSVRLDDTAAPFCRCSHRGLHSVPPGMPLRIDVVVRLDELGEVVGELRLYYSSSQDRREREVVVPVYCMVCPPSTSAAATVAGPTRPRSLSERSVMAAKATREAMPRAVVIGAAAAPPLGQRGPRPRSASAGSSGAAAAAAAAVQTSCTTLPQPSYSGPRRAWFADTTAGGQDNVDEGIEEEPSSDPPPAAVAAVEGVRPSLEATCSGSVVEEPWEQSQPEGIAADRAMGEADGAMEEAGVGDVDGAAEAIKRDADAVGEHGGADDWPEVPTGDGNVGAEADAQEEETAVRQEDTGPWAVPAGGGVEPQDSQRGSARDGGEGAWGWAPEQEPQQSLRTRQWALTLGAGSLGDSRASSVGVSAEVSRGSLQVGHEGSDTVVLAAADDGH